MDSILDYYKAIAKPVAYERTFILCDPYGNVPYNACEKDGRMGIRVDYHNQMRDMCMPQILHYGWSNGINMQFCNMEDVEFFARFHDYYPVYHQDYLTVDEYAFAFVDGPHDLLSVELAAQFYCARTPVGAHIVFDNVPYYDHGPVHDRMLREGFEQVEAYSEKIAYERTRIPPEEVSRAHEAIGWARP